MCARAAAVSLGQGAWGSLRAERGPVRHTTCPGPSKPASSPGRTKGILALSGVRRRTARGSAPPCSRGAWDARRGGAGRGVRIPRLRASPGSDQPWSISLEGVFSEEGIGEVDLGSEFVLRQTRLMWDCFQETFGYPMVPGVPEGATPLELARAVFLAEVGVLAHDRVVVDGEYENIFNYANRTSLVKFERTWVEQTAIASSKSADGDASVQSGRNTLLSQALHKGGVPFSTVRQSASGKDLNLKDGRLWNLSNERGIYVGQAATYDFD